MVGLHKFYETDNAIHLLLQYATGGKLWTYIGAYLHSSRGNTKDNGPGIVTDRDHYTHAYMGQKIHSSENSVQKPSKPEACENRSVARTTDGECKDAEFAALHMKYSDENETLSHGHTSPGDTGASGPKSKSSDGGTVNCDTDATVVGKKARNYTLSSISSLDNPEIGETHTQEYKSCSLDNKEFQIHDIFENSKSNLECFSINSIESNDGVQRMDSNASDNLTFECIPEESELSPSHRPCVDDDVFSEVKTGAMPADSQEGHIGVRDEDTELIVQNAKELIRCVERTLSGDDAEVEKLISPKKNSDFDVESERNSSVLDGCDLSLATPTSQSDSDLQDKSGAKGQSSESPGDGYDSSNETSIYDMNRSSEGQSSDASDGGQVKELTHSPIQSMSDDMSKSTRSNTLVKSLSDPDLPSRKYSDLGNKESRSSTFTETSLPKHPTPPKRLSLTRMNSKELSRSASMERELTSPMKMRHLSGVFQQLDLATNSPEQVRLPESCIQQWVAEVVVALARLHAEGILCR